MQERLAVVTWIRDPVMTKHYRLVGKGSFNSGFKRAIHPVVCIYQSQEVIVSHQALVQHMRCARKAAHDQQHPELDGIFSSPRPYPRLP